MNILIVTEKPSVTHRIAPFARQHWPDAAITFVHAAPYGNILFNYPRGLKLAELPAVSEPRNRLRAWAEWYCVPLILAADGELSRGEMGLELFTAADLIVAACDPDHTGAVGFEVLMQQVFGDDRANDCPALTLFAFDNPAILNSFARLAPFGEVAASWLGYGRMKRYFDWNWNVNSLAILGEAQRRAGVPVDAPPLSKYALQLLYGLRDRPPMTDGTIAVMMSSWPGTGRYKAARGARNPQLGSPAAFAVIMENLIKAELLERSMVAGKSHLGLSVRGRTLLSLLHPDCEDADLPFRLNAWCEQGMAAKPAVDRYIKTFFGKQLRFQGAV